VTVLANVKADQVTVKQVVLSYNSAPPSLFPTSQPSVHHKRSSSDSESGLSGGGLIGVIVAAAAVFFVFVGVVLYYRLALRKTTLVSVNPVGVGIQNNQFAGVVPGGSRRSCGTSIQVQPRTVNL
jgi:hypothetical protein